MNKEEFLATLKRALKNMPAVDLDEIIYDYEEYFQIGVSEGKTEEEIVTALGDPNYLARQFNANYHVKKAEEETSVSNTFRAVLATLGMGFFNLVVVLGPFLALLGTLFGLFVAAGSIIVAGIAIFAASVFGPILPITFDSTLFQFIRPEATLFASIGLICLGLLFLIGDVYLGKLLFSGMVRYLKFNLKIIKGA